MEKKIKNSISSTNKNSNIVQKKLYEINILLSKTDMASLQQLIGKK